MATIRASEQGIEQIDRARRKLGWQKQASIWCDRANISLATLKRFWRRESIAQDAFVGICQAVEIADWAAIAEWSPSRSIQFLSEMPEGSILLGRESELNQLLQWIEQSSRVITIWGMGGIGKTAIAIALVEKLSDRFELVVWNSIQSTTVLSDLTQSVISQCDQSDLLSCLQNRKFLWILDGWEALTDSYGEFLKTIAQGRHESCIVITSREKPAEIAQLEAQVRSLKLNGIGDSSIELLRQQGLMDELEALQALSQLYRGNPLALNMIASLIRDLCSGSAREFLELNTIVLHQMESVISERVKHLSSDERNILQLLAQSDQALSRQEVRSSFPSIGASALLEALISLEWKCLLETYSDPAQPTFTLQPVVMKFVRKHL